MNELAMPLSSITARWYLWEGGFLALGKSDDVVPPHSHHAIQVVLALDGQIGIKGETGDWQVACGVVVRQDVVHSYEGRGAVIGMLFVDPESYEGSWLQSSVTEDVTLVPATRMESAVGALRTFRERPMEALDIRDLVRHVVRTLCAGAPPARRMDERVTRVLAAVRASDDLHFSLEQAADMAFLSPSRFAHLFKEQVGLPFRRYMLWRKLTRAVVSIGRERTVAAAAHASDFADAAHLTRTFGQMFGIPPSVMLRGDLFEIAPPFDLSGSPGSESVQHQR